MLKARLKPIQWALAIASLGLMLGGAPAIANDSLTRLSATDVTAQLDHLPGWETDGQQLSCTYQFANFVESIQFVNRLVEPAEAVGHHPDIAIAYNKVTVSLTTHDAGGLTQQDLDLAQTIDRLRACPSL